MLLHNINGRLEILMFGLTELRFRGLALGALQEDLK